MERQASKNFIAVTLGVVLAMSGLTWLSSQTPHVKDAPAVTAQTIVSAQPVAAAQTNDDAQSVANDPATADPNLSSFDQGYRAGYQDGHRDCQGTSSAARTSARATTTRRTYRAPRSGVAGARYYAEPRRGHSTRDMILTIAAPAAIGAGIGALVGGKKGAGIGALFGGGGGALYHLIKKRRR
jgi:hypothetical protein